MTPPDTDQDFMLWLGRRLTWTGIVMLLVGAKLVLSYFVPGLKTPGELVLSGGLLLVSTVQVFRVRAAVADRAAGS